MDTSNCNIEQNECLSVFLEYTLPEKALTVFTIRYNISLARYHICPQGEEMHETNRTIWRFLLILSFNRHGESQWWCTFYSDKIKPFNGWYIPLFPSLYEMCLWKDITLAITTELWYTKKELDISTIIQGKPFLYKQLLFLESIVY